MHREIQIKQFPIVTTHWWPKTRNERFVWENEQYLYRFLPLVHNHVQVIWVHTHIRCVTCVRALWQWVTYTCERSLPALAQTNAPFTRGVGVNASRWLWMEWRQALPNWIVGPSRRFTGAARCRSWKIFNFSSANGGVSQSDRLMQIPNPIHATPEKYVIGCCNYDGASAPCFRHALRQALTPTPRVNAAWYQTCMNFFVLLNTERKIFWRKFVTRLFWDTIDFNIRKKKLLWKSMVPQICSVSTFIRISCFVFSRTNTFIQVWNYFGVNDDRIFIFGWTIPLRSFHIDIPQCFSR